MPLSGIVGTETVTVAGTAIGLAHTSTGKSNAAFISVEAAAIRWWANSGDTPTATVGHIAEPGDTITLCDRDSVMAFLAIRKDGVSATLSVSHARAYIP